MAVIGKYTGKIIVGVGMLMIIPLVTSLVFAEWDTAVDFVISMMVCFVFGFGTQLVCRTSKDLAWSHGLVVASGSWIWATLIGCMPHYLSSHEGSYLDSMFDVMSGYTTTGMYLLQDLDHVSNGLNMWRHVLTYAGGQGIVVIALTFLFKGTGAIYQLYAGEGKEERLLPNVINTARAIWVMSLGWLIAGWVLLSAAGLWLGMRPDRAILHGLWMFMGAFSTGGFAPQSFNTIWFHSSLYEALCVVIFVAGSLNFAMHWSLWHGHRAELRKNIEIRSFAVTLVVLSAAAAWALADTGIYGNGVVLFRKVFYQLVSAHTTTGFGTIYSRSFVTQWGEAAMLATIAAMALGASSCSTAGGIKALRVGLITKSFLGDIRRLISPGSARITVRYHHIRDQILNDDTARVALTVTLTFVTMYAVVVFIGVLFGYPLADAAFEGVSAASNSGLSCGLLSPTTPDGLKLSYVIAMWLGRLEFVAVLATAGWLWASVKGR
ncbi:MAG: cation transporter [Actinobacteria bacterium HGW-Actinobacteria-7]|nr:MAG: cation transporter [Actinobacteria bacterium HGW-Actinobacteria-7]